VPTLVPISQVFGCLAIDLGRSLDPEFKACSSPPDTDKIQILNPQPMDNSFRCAKCLSLGHQSSSWCAPWQCFSCHNYDHKARWCLTKARPNLFWAPKSTSTACTANSKEIEGSPLEASPLDCHDPEKAVTLQISLLPQNIVQINRRCPHHLHRCLIPWRTSLATPCCSSQLECMWSMDGIALLEFEWLLVVSRFAVLRSMRSFPSTRSHIRARFLASCSMSVSFLSISSMSGSCLPSHLPLGWVFFSSKISFSVRSS
jgi:hypothetical protein